MASNLVPSSSSFTTTNMKPASGEEVSALLTQNIVDNTGYNYYEMSKLRKPAIWNEGTLGYATFAGGSPPFVLKFRHNLPIYVYRGRGDLLLTGTGVGTITCTSNDNPDLKFTDGFVFQGDLGTYTKLRSGTVNIPTGTVIGSTYEFSIDMTSYLSEGKYGVLDFIFYGTVDNTSSGEQVAAYSDTRPFCYTTWA